MKIIAKYLGGSRIYDLAGPDSDYDYRGVFLNTDRSKILGLQKWSSRENRTDKESDHVLRELTHFCVLLQKGNSEALDALWVEDADFTELQPEFVAFRDQRDALIDSERLFSGLRGYLQGEFALAFGGKTGRLGHKRHEAIKAHGFSPKNVVQAVRLCEVGRHFFKTGVYHPKAQDEETQDSLRTIKFNPALYSAEILKNYIHVKEEAMVRAYEKRIANFTFDKDLCNNLIVETYRKVLYES